jgi:hypothetical protein
VSPNTTDAAPATGTPAAWQSWLPAIYKAYAIAVAVCVVGAFTESFANLIVYFRHAGLALGLAIVAPSMIDIFTIGGEGLVLIATVNRWERRYKIAGWCATFAGLAVSVAGNVGKDGWQGLTPNRSAAYAIAPLALAGLLALGLAIVKRALAPEPDAAETDETVRRAVIMFRADLAEGRMPPLRPIKEKMGVAQPAAQRIQAALAPLLPLAPLLAAPHLAKDEAA